MDKCTYLYSEARIAEHLGMPRKELVKTRRSHLVQDSDWTLRNGEVVLCLRGVSRLMYALDLPAGRIDVTACYSDRDKKKSPVLLLCDRDHIPSPIKMKVRRIFPNPRLIEAVEVNRPSQLCQVLVKANENLTIGMQFEAIPDVGNPGFWKLAGPVPRWRGRW